jgi:hypothetical protein
MWENQRNVFLLPLDVVVLYNTYDGAEVEETERYDRFPQT